MNVDPLTGEVTWTPQAGDEGIQPIVLVATDPEAAEGSQVFRLDVRLNNADPQITSTPTVTTIAGATGTGS